MTRPAAIGFDLGDTLCEYAGVALSWVDEYPAALAAVAERCGQELTAARLDAGIRLLLRYNTRTTPRQNDEEHAAERIFGELLEAWGSPRAARSTTPTSSQAPAAGEAMASAVSAFFGYFRQTLRAFPESAGVLRKLQELGLPAGILTDVPYGMPRALVTADLFSTALAIPDALLLTSVEVGHRKPHPAGFTALAGKLGVPRPRLLYVGNERKDIDGARAAGCQAALIWRTSTEIPAWGQARTLRTLDELFELL